MAALAIGPENPKQPDEMMIKAVPRAGEMVTGRVCTPYQDPQQSLYLIQGPLLANAKG
jgi:hypothetical protein